MRDRQLSHHLRGGVPGDALRPPVPEEDAPAQIGGDDAVHGRVDEPLEELLGLAQLRLDAARLGDVAEAEDGAPVLRPEGPRRDAQHQAAAIASLDL